MTLQPRDYAMLNADTPDSEPVRVLRVDGTQRHVIRLKPGIYTSAGLFMHVEADDLEPITRADMARWMDEERVI